MTKVGIREEQRTTCREFASKYADTVEDIYKKHRKQDKRQIIIEQAFWAKLAEVAVEQELGRIGVEIINGVDFSIHKRERKSFDADIKTNTARIHIKSVHYNRAERSWAFQKSDPVVYAPEENDILVFCVTYPTYVEIVGACKALEVLDFYAPPRKSELSESKQCLYWNNDPQRFSVPEIKDILQSLKSVVETLDKSIIDYTAASSKIRNFYAWREF